MNTIGATVKSETKANRLDRHYEIDLSTLSNGFYFLEIISGNDRRVEKVQVSH
jgi:hypothetical protein